MSFNYTKEDFETPKPFEDLNQYNFGSFTYESKLNKLEEYADSIGVKRFNKLYKAYCKERSKALPTAVCNYMNFPNQQCSLATGEYLVDYTGVHLSHSKDNVEVCSHPILTGHRLRNLDTGEEKIELAFQRAREPWRLILVEKTTIASAVKIIELAKFGIAVTSENAKTLVKYLAEIEKLNLNVFPLMKSVSHLGYIEGEGFMPYTKGITFDGMSCFKDLFEAVSQKGDFESWKRAASEVCTGSIPAEILLSASFASVLVEPLKLMPFFVHLWSVESGNGKTVALMLAASVWGNPAIGKYVRDFDTTAVGMERSAAFLNNLPLCIDESQLSRDGHGQVSVDPYRLAGGTSRMRGKKQGGVEQMSSWRLTVLTTGESPLVKTNDGAGAMNRVFEVEAKAGEKIVTDGSRTVGCIAENYGFAGKQFVEHLYQPAVLKSVKERYFTLMEEFSGFDSTGKQVNMAALILLANQLMHEWILPGTALSKEVVAQYMRTANAVSTGERGFEFICNWFAVHNSEFCENGSRECIGAKYNCHGTNEVEYIYVLEHVFVNALKEGGFSPQPVLSYMKEKGLLVHSKKNLKLSRKINGYSTTGYGIRMPR